MFKRVMALLMINDKSVIKIMLRPMTDSVGLEALDIGDGREALEKLYLLNDICLILAD